MYTPNTTATSSSLCIAAMYNVRTKLRVVQLSTDNSGISFVPEIVTDSAPYPSQTDLDPALVGCSAISQSYISITAGCRIDTEMQQLTLRPLEQSLS